MLNKRAVFFLGLLIVLPLGVMGQVVPPPIPPPPPPGLSIDQGEYVVMAVAVVFGVIKIRKGKS
jgi:hypothetical protein